MSAEEPCKPEASVKMENGIFKVRGSVKVEADPDVVHAIIRNHEESAQVFKSLRSVDVVYKGRDHTIVTQHAEWRFLFWSGVYSVTLRFKHDPHERTTSFQLERPGLMKQFNGFWTITPCSNEKLASMVVLRQEVQLAITPPRPFARFGGQIIANQMKGVLNDLVDASRNKNGHKPQ